MKRLIAICDPETEYACRLMEFINRKKKLPFRAAAFDSFALLTEAAEHTRTEIVLLSERYLKEKVEELNVKQIIILSEDQDAGPDAYQRVYKYQSGASILREIESAYEAEMRAGGQGRPLKAQGNIYGIYSPAGGSGKTSLALALGQELAREHRVLYLNMESCPALEAILGIETDRNISDLIYCSRKGQEDRRSMLSAMTVSIQNLDCIMPVSNFEDIACTRPEEWMEIIGRIDADGIYDFILIEPSGSMQGFMDILDCCSCVIMPFRNDLLSQAKVESYERMLAECGADEILEKTVRVRVPYFNVSGLGRNYYEGLIWSELGDCVRDLIRKEGIA